MNGTGEPRADRWTRESFTFRRMTWGNIGLILVALMLMAVAVATGLMS
jgi:hypothetical protein